MASGIGASASNSVAGVDTDPFGVRMIDDDEHGGLPFTHERCREISDTHGVQCLRVDNLVVAVRSAPLRWRIGRWSPVATSAAPDPAFSRPLFLPTTARRSDPGGPRSRGAASPAADRVRTAACRVPGPVTFRRSNEPTGCIRKFNPGGREVVIDRGRGARYSSIRCVKRLTIVGATLTAIAASGVVRACAIAPTDRKK